MRQRPFGPADAARARRRGDRMISRFMGESLPVAREGGPQLHPNLKLDDTVPFRLSRNHFMIEKRDGSYYVHDLRNPWNDR